MVRGCPSNPDHEVGAKRHSNNFQDGAWLLLQWGRRAGGLLCGWKVNHRDQTGASYPVEWVEAVDGMTSSKR